MEDLAAYFASLGAAQQGPEITGGQVGRGRDKAATCIACHGEAGISLTPEWPTLAGQHESYLLLTMEQYKDGTRQDPVMAGLVLAFSQQDLEDLAVFYAAQQGMFTATGD